MPLQPALLLQLLVLVHLRDQALLLCLLLLLCVVVVVLRVVVVLTPLLVQQAQRLGGQVGQLGQLVS